MTLTIGQKIGAAFTAILSLIVTIGITVYQLNSSIHLASKDIHLDDVPGVILYLQILDEIGDMHSNVVEYSTGELDEIEDFHANNQEFKDYFSQLVPLESDTASDKKKLETIKRLVTTYVDRITEEVFNQYNPADEVWARETVDNLEHKQGAELEALLDSLKEKEIADALASANIEETVIDNFQGVRYYLELVDEAGDMLASLSDYVGGEDDEEEEFRGNADDFARYLNLLEEVEQEASEIRQIITITRLYDDILRTADAVFKRYNPTDKTNAFKLIDTLEHDVIKELEIILDQSSLEEQADADRALTQLTNTVNTVNTITLTLTGLSLVIGLIISYWLSNTILRAVGGEPSVIAGIANEVAKGNINMSLEITDGDVKKTGVYAALMDMVSALKTKIEMTEKVAQGNLSSEIELASDKDILGIALNKMQLNFKEMVEKANAFATGDYESQIIPRSDQDEFGNALSSMMQQVTDRNIQFESQGWLKTQVVKISKLSQGINDLQEMAEKLIFELAGILQAGHAVFYVLDEEQENGRDHYRLLSGYAYVERKNIANRYAEGEGLVGQCALEKNTILLTNVPDDYIQISSGLGEKKPLNIVLLPVLFDRKCIAVIEVASFQYFTSNEMEFLNQAVANLGVTMNSLIGRKRIVELLQQSQRQTEELQSQSEELQASNDELELKAEKLNQQSNALKFTNTDLEEKTKALEIKQRDIEIKNQQIEEKAKELTIASKYKSEFLANMSHELRTPLNSLLLLAKGLSENKQGNLNTVQVEDAQVIYDGGNSLLTLINDIMDLSKVEAGKLTIHDEPVSLDLLERNLNKMFLPLAKDRGLIFTIDIAENLSNSFSSDGLRLEQILRNLLSNAMKFTQHGEILLSIKRASLETQFTHSSLSPENSIEFSVIDSGIGIPEDKQLAIFEAFQQEDGTTSRKYGGTGLGLTIARELSRLLGGEIRLKSELGVGSTFTLYLSSELNQTDDKAKEFSTTNTETEILTSNASTEVVYDDRYNIIAGDNTLLIIDDQQFINSIKYFAKQNQYKCLLTADSSTAIALANQYHPNGIIMDVGLPEVDGCQLMEQLKSAPETQHIPVQIISGDVENKQKILAMGAIGFLTKPVTEEDLNPVFLRIKELTQTDVRKILLIEDDLGNLKATSQLLKNDNVKVNTATTGKEGYDEIIGDSYDAIILDLGLPDMSGFDLLKLLDENEIKNIPPIIIYTGKEISSEEQKQLDHYSASIVIKGAGSAERLEDDLSLFLHQESKVEVKEVSLLHDDLDMLKNRKVLLVDDDMRASYALSKNLMELGVVVELAENGEEAIKLMEQVDDIELVLMDSMMPVMDGNTAIQLIRKMDNYKDIPIIALTAKTMPEDKEQFLHSGASEYLTKPFDFNNLVSIIRIWLFEKK